ncbi:MAG: porin [Pseudomonadota bacterium]
MKKRNRNIFSLILLILFFPDLSAAYDINDDIQIHGFLSQGYLDSSGNNFLADSKGGTCQFNEIGVNLNGRINHKLRYGAQILSRSLGDYGDNRIRLDWGLVDFHSQDWAGIRLGKVKIPIGFYNTERDSDFLRPMIFLPQSIYDETRRDNWLSHWGGEIYGSLATESIGDFDYQLFYGRVEYDDDSVLHDATLTNINSRLASIGNPLFPSAIDRFNRKNDNLYGFSLIYAPPVENLRLGFSFIRQEDAFSKSGLALGSYRTNSNFVLSLEYILQNFTICAEYGENDRTQTLLDSTTFDGPNQSWYVMLTYALTDKLSFSVLYDEYYRDKHDKKSSSHLSGRANPTPWRKDWGFGVRYDFNENWTMKGEWHTVDGAALLQDFFNSEGVARYWQYGALKISFNF